MAATFLYSPGERGQYLVERLGEGGEVSVVDGSVIELGGEASQVCVPFGVTRFGWGDCDLDFAFDDFDR